jgi:hypothetical protein
VDEFYRCNPQVPKFSQLVAIRNPTEEEKALRITDKTDVWSCASQDCSVSMETFNRSVLRLLDVGNNNIQDLAVVLLPYVPSRNDASSSLRSWFAICNLHFAVWAETRLTLPLDIE